MRGGPHRSSIPALANALISIATPRDLRDAVLGDLEEEVNRRSVGSGRSADGWLWGQVLRSLGPWAIYRLPRSRHARTSLAIVTAWVVVPAVMALFNTNLVIGWVRSLPADARIPLAWALNWSAVAVAAFLAGRVTLNRSGRFALLLGGVLVLLNSVGWDLNLGAARWPGLLVTLSTLAVTWIGVRLAGGGAVFEPHR